MYTTSYYNCSPVSFDGKFPQLPSKAFINLAIIEKDDINRCKADKFTKGTLHGHADEILKKKSAIEVEAVLVLPQGHQRMKCVFIEGAPGVGKSTLVWELCRRRNDIEAIKNYSLVILLRLRQKEVQEINTVADLFFHCDSDLQSAVAKEVIECEGDKILFILDGFDELPVNLRKNSFLVNLIKGVHLPKCTVLVTSRPSATADLLSVCRPQIHKHIEVIGFTQDHIEQYVNSMLSGEPEICNDFLKYISTQPAIRGMMYIPLNSAIVLEIYRANIANCRPIPCTMTELYRELCLILLNKYLAESNGPLTDQLLDDLDHIPSSLKTQLLKLGQLACEGALKQEISFSRLPDGCKDLGFINVSTSLYLGRILLSYSFLHLTLQEFLAAFYVSHLPLSDQKLIFTTNFLRSESHMDVLLRFIAGFRGSGSFLFDVLRNIPSDDHYNVLLTYCLFEAHNDETVIAVCNELCTSHDHHNVMTSKCDTPFQCYTSGYCISASQCKWSVRLDMSDMDEAVDMLGCGLRSTKNVRGSINTLTIPLYHFTKLGVSHFSKLPSEILTHIEQLHFLVVKLDRPTIDSLADVIPSMINLNNLKIRCANCGPEMTKLLQSLEKVPLKYLHIGASGLDCNDITALSQLIKPTNSCGPCLKKLYMYTWNMLDEGIATLLLETVLSPSSIEILKLDGQMFPPESSNTFSLLGKNDNINYLKIGTTQFIKCYNSSNLAQHLMKSLHKNTSVQSMKLRDFKLNSDGVLAMSDTLRLNQSLKLLEIEDETLTPDEILILSSALQHNKTLESLILDGISDDCKQLIMSGKLDTRIKIK